MNALDMNISAKRLLLGGVAVLGVVALTGCGGGGSSLAPASTGNPNTETETETETDTKPGNTDPGPNQVEPEKKPSTPAVMFSSATRDVRENGDREITVTLSAPAPTGGLTLKYTVDGGAEKTVTVNAGERTAIITLTLADNTATETRTIVLVGGDGYTLGTQKEIALTILEENARVVTITRPSGGLTAGGTTSITVRLEPAPTTNLTLNYTITGGDAPVTGTVTVNAGTTTATIDVTIPAGGSGTRTLTLTDGDGNAVGGEPVTLPVTGTPPPPPPPPSGILGPMDQAALNTAIDGVTKPTCGTDADCIRIVKTLEDRAKAYNPLDDYNELVSESVGSGTFADARDSQSPPTWISEVETYQLDIGSAYFNLEAAPAPYLKNSDGSLKATAAAAIRAAVSGAVSNRGANFDGNDDVNRIASDLGNNPSDREVWGIWIKEGDATGLYYWHTEGGTATGGTNSAAGFPVSAGYAGTATYSGSVAGYGHYTDASDSNALVAGDLSAAIDLRADFGESSGEFVRGSISGFNVNGTDPGWEDVTLNHDYTVQGATTEANVTGGWRSDYVYGVADTFGDGSQRQPESIRGRVVLDFTGTTANQGNAAGVFEASQPPSP